jgi:hypothetical protein
MLPPFLPITTRQAPLRHPLSVAQVINIVDKGLEQPAVTVLHPGPQHARFAGTSGNRG